MRSRCAKVCKHLLSIVCCAVALGILASEIARESTRPESVVQLEPQAEPVRGAPLADADRVANEEPAKILPKTEPQRQQETARTPEPPKQDANIALAQPPTEPKKAPAVPLFVAPPLGDIEQVTWDHVFEKTASKEYTGVAAPAAPAKEEVIPPVAATEAPKPPLIENVAPAPNQPFGKVSVDEIFAPMMHQEPVVPPANPSGPDQKMQTTNLTEPAPAKSQAILQTTPILAKSSAAPIVVSPPMQMNPKATWDEVFDGITRQQQPVPDPTIPEKVAAAPPALPRLDGEEASTAPPLGGLPGLPQYPSPENGPVPVERGSVLPSLPALPPPPELDAGQQPLPPPAMGRAPASPDAPPVPRALDVPQPVRPSITPLPSAAKVTSQLVKDNFMGLPPATSSTPPALVPMDIPAPITPVAARGPSGAPPVNTSGSIDGTCDPTEAIWITPSTAEPPMVKPPQKNGRPSWLEKIFSTAVPQKPSTTVSERLPQFPPVPATQKSTDAPLRDRSPQLPPFSATQKSTDAPLSERAPQLPAFPAIQKSTDAPLSERSLQIAPLNQKTLQTSVFGGTQEKVNNFVDLRKMIAASYPPPPEKPNAALQLPPLPKKSLAMVADPPLPPAPMENAVTLVKAEPSVNTVLLPKLPEPIDPAVKPAAAQNEANSGSKVAQTAAQDPCPNCARPNNGISGLPPSDLLSGGHCESCGQGTCVPGRKPCYPCESPIVLSGFFCDLYQCICCPDPCYEGKWIPQADAAFFVDSARPQSQMRIGYDSGHNVIFPDRSEYFWARADGKGKGPMPVSGSLGEPSVNYDQLTLYTEAAVGGVFSTFVSYPYLSVDPTVDPHASGFGDLSIGTKTLLFDCELLQATFQMKTTIPTGIASKGLGTGHVSLEPSLLFALKLSRDTYFQGQLAEWIPIAGDTNYAGSIFETKFSVNHVLCRILPNVPLLATLESNTWSFQHGQYTDPTLGGYQRSSGATYASLGPGLRLVVCDRIDFGVGSQFALTSEHFAQTLVRVEFRFRY